MNRKNKRFAVAPSSVNMNRSTFDMPYRHLDTGNFGKIIPFYVSEVLPGDTFSVDTSILARMSTPRFPVMDDAWLDVMYFFCPNRLVWSHWAEFLGENKLSAWVATEDYVLPNTSVIPEPGSVFDHMGLPTYSSDAKAQEAGLPARPSVDTHVLPFRMYNLIYNEWFRNQNTTDPVLVNTGDDVTAQEIASFQTLRNAAKPFDYFTAALPSPQKGDPVDIPLVGSAPVLAGDIHGGSGVEMTMNSKYPLDGPGFAGLGMTSVAGGDENTVKGYYPDNQAESTGYYYSVSPSNLWADLSQVNGTTINQLRQAFQMQRLLELQARSGSRYTEIILSSFGVRSPDARLQRPEFLCGKTIRIQMQQVTQTSETTDESPLGKVGAYSKTASAGHDFDYSFTEHGYVIGVMVARHALTYQQGLQPHWSRRTRYNFYWPTFAHIGEQPIPLKALYYTGLDADAAAAAGNSNLNQNRTFGFNEAWCEYRTKPNECTGAFRSTVEPNLDEWHYADYYTSAPFLSEGWMNASGENVDRTLEVTSALHDQLIFDIRVDNKATRVMPLYSIPGMIDHF